MCFHSKGEIGGFMKKSFSKLFSMSGYMCALLGMSVDSCFVPSKNCEEEVEAPKLIWALVMELVRAPASYSALRASGIEGGMCLPGRVGWSRLLFILHQCCWENLA